MFEICIAAFFVGILIGVVYAELTWNEEHEIQKLRFERSRKNIDR